MGQNELRTKLNIGPLHEDNNFKYKTPPPPKLHRAKHTPMYNQSYSDRKPNSKAPKKRASAIGLLFKKISKPKRKNTEDITISTASSKNKKKKKKKKKKNGGEKKKKKKKKKS